MNTNCFMDNIRNKIYVCDVCNAHFPSLCNLDWHKMKHLANGYYSCASGENAYMDNDVRKLQNVEHISQMQYSNNISNDNKYSSLLKTEDSCSLYEQHVACSAYSVSRSTPVSGIHLEENANNNVDIKSHLCYICGEAFQKNVDLCLHLKCHNNETPALIDRIMHIPKHLGETMSMKSINDQTVMKCPQIEGDGTKSINDQTVTKCPQIEGDAMKSINDQTVTKCPQIEGDGMKSINDQTVTKCPQIEGDGMKSINDQTVTKCPQVEGDGMKSINDQTVTKCSQIEGDGMKSINDQTVTKRPQIEGDGLAQLVQRYCVFNLHKPVNSNIVSMITEEHVEDNISCLKDISAIARRVNNSSSFVVNPSRESIPSSPEERKIDLSNNQNVQSALSPENFLSMLEGSKMESPCYDNTSNHSQEKCPFIPEKGTIQPSSTSSYENDQSAENSPLRLENDSNDDDGLSYNEESKPSVSDIEPEVVLNDNSDDEDCFALSHNEEIKPSLSDIEPGVILNDNSEDNGQLLYSTSTDNLTNSDLKNMRMEDNEYHLIATSVPRTLRNRTRHSIADKPHVCDVCDKAFKKYHNLIVHFRVHSGNRPFPCTVCDKKFTQNVALQDHMKLHTGCKPYRCCFCEKSFTQKVNMRSHQQVHFQQSSRPYPCTVCDKRFSQTNGVQSHMMLHTGCKPFKCGFCEKSFVQKVNMKKHERVHTGMKPYKCNVCVSTFAQRNHLQKHSLTHTGEKPYKCRFCQKNFSQSSNLKTHMMIHTGEKPHKCSLCGKRFIQSNNLRKHAKTHTTQNEHQCVLCPTSFAHAGNLVKHIKSEHSVKDYKKHLKQLDIQNRDFKKK